MDPRLSWHGRHSPLVCVGVVYVQHENPVVEVDTEDLEGSAARQRRRALERLEEAKVCAGRARARPLMVPGHDHGVIVVCCATLTGGAAAMDAEAARRRHNEQGEGPQEELPHAAEEP